MTIDRREQQQHQLRAAELLYAAINNGDLATLVKIIDEGIEVRVAGTPTAHKGLKGFGEWYKSQGDKKIEVTDVAPVGVSHMVVSAQGRADVLEFRDGKIAAILVHPTQAEALKAAKAREAKAGDG